jgi:hypothetical protein
MPDIFIDKEPKKEEPKPKEATPVVQTAAISEPPTQDAAPHPHADAVRSVQALLTHTPANMGLFAAYSIHPKGVHFANQESDEIILLFVRAHVITNVPWIFTTIIAAIIPPLLILLSQLLQVLPFHLPLGLTVIGIGFYYLILLGYAFGKFVSWFYNIGVITQKRIVDIDTSNILAHNTAAASFNELVDVKFTQQGFFQSFFNYGNVDIQTEARHANFEFTAAPHPTEVVDIISDLRVAQEGGHHGRA